MSENHTWEKSWCFCFVFNDLRQKVSVCFIDIGGIVDHHCLEVVVCFIDIGGIVDHHCSCHYFVKRKKKIKQQKKRKVNKS